MMMTPCELCQNHYISSAIQLSDKKMGVTNGCELLFTLKGLTFGQLSHVARKWAEHAPDCFGSPAVTAAISWLSPKLYKKSVCETVTTIEALLVSKFVPWQRQNPMAKYLLEINESRRHGMGHSTGRRWELQQHKQEIMQQVLLVLQLVPLVDPDMAEDLSWLDIMVVIMVLSLHPQPIWAFNNDVPTLATATTMVH